MLRLISAITFYLFIMYVKPLHQEGRDTILLEGKRIQQITSVRAGDTVKSGSRLGHSYFYKVTEKILQIELLPSFRMKGECQVLYMF